MSDERISDRVFSDLIDARSALEAWRETYNYRLRDLAETTPAETTPAGVTGATIRPLMPGQRPANGTATGAREAIAHTAHGLGAPGPGRPTDQN